MADDQDQLNSGVQDDGSTASRSESGTRPKDGISDDQLEHDFISVEALSSEDLQYIVGNAKYRHVWSDLLSPYLETEDVLDNSEAESEASADRMGPADRLEQGTDHTRLIQVHPIWPSEEQERTPPLYQGSVRDPPVTGNCRNI